MPGTVTVWGQYPSVPPIAKDGTTVLLENYATLPNSGRGGSITDFGPHTNLTDQLSRPNFMVSEPAGAPLSSSRFFVPDLNRNLYILDKSSKTFTACLQYKTHVAETNGTDLSGDVSATGITASKTSIIVDDLRLFRVMLLP